MARAPDKNTNLLPLSFSAQKSASPCHSASSLAFPAALTLSSSHPHTLPISNNPGLQVTSGFASILLTKLERWGVVRWWQDESSQMEWLPESGPRPGEALV